MCVQVSVPVEVCFFDVELKKARSPQLHRLLAHVIAWADRLDEENTRIFSACEPELSVTSFGPKTVSWRYVSLS